jgi:hypothetical protein
MGGIDGLQTFLVSSMLGILTAFGDHDEILKDDYAYKKRMFIT